jgi:hypothetical protein
MPTAEGVVFIAADREEYSGRMEDKRVARTGALTRYIALLRREQGRLDQVRTSPRAKQLDRDNAETGLRSAAEKILHADKELRGLGMRFSPTTRRF